jgi:hypothetical protein
MKNEIRIELITETVLPVESCLNSEIKKLKVRFNNTSFPKIKIVVIPKDKSEYRIKYDGRLLIKESFKKTNGISVEKVCKYICIELEKIILENKENFTMSESVEMKSIKMTTQRKSAKNRGCRKNAHAATFASPTY